jgi:hypothetical protein
VWTAIHLNVPPHGEDQHRQWCRKAKWVILAIFAPELAVFTAWQQFYWAKRLLSSLRNIEVPKEERGSNGPSENLNDEKVSNSYAFFVATFITVANSVATSLLHDAARRIHHYFPLLFFRGIARV